MREKAKAMKRHNFIKKTASRVVSWILVMAMLVTLPQTFPTGAQDVYAADEGVNITLHYENHWGWDTPALQYWNGTITVTGNDGEPQEIPSWGVDGNFLTQDEDPNFYTITLTGSTTSSFGFQFLDYTTPGNNTGGVFVSTMTAYNEDTPTDLYYLYKGDAYGWYMDAAGTTPLTEPEYTNLTIHYQNANSWGTPAVQYWDAGKIKVSGQVSESEIPGWDAKGHVMTEDSSNAGFYTITLKGTIAGVQFLDLSDPSKNTAGSVYHSELTKFKNETPTDVYYMYIDDAWGWYMDQSGEVTLESTTPISEGIEVTAQGFVKFTAVEEGASKVELVYGLKDDEGKNLNTVTMTAGIKNSYTAELWLGDAAEDYIYYYVVDDVERAIADAAESFEGHDFLVYEKAEFTGRVVTVPGTMPGKSWDPAVNLMTYIGEGIYTYEFKDVPAGNYQYKIALNENWDENYGKNGVVGGDNIVVTVPIAQDVTIYYCDYSHFSRTSVDYDFGASIALTGTGIPAETKMMDSRLTGIYSVAVALAAGTYSDTVIEYNGQNYEFEDDYEVTTERAEKVINFYFDPETEIFYNDASDVTVETEHIKYDTKDTAYKSTYGAVATGEYITFKFDTGEDATQVRMIVKGKENKKLVMDKDGAAESDVQRWTITEKFDTLGEYQYFFVVYVGTAIAVYGDDDGNYGTGTTCNLLDLVPYDLVVYQSGFETPDWMKDAVIYQIFPDRFFDGDVSNNTAQTTARGEVDYEYVTDWYLYPENPEQPAETYPSTAYLGDGQWSNEIYGGDLEGIIERIDYLEALGVNVIYLNPVFSSISSHRYDTSDYGVIDPILGDLGDFQELVRVADEHNMKVVLDGVFNHVSDDSIYFDRYYKYLGKDGNKKVGAYPYWAFVYDYMETEEVAQEDAEAAAKSYFEDEYGIEDFSYAEWFDVFSDSVLLDDKGEDVCDNVGLRAGKPVYGYDGWWGYDSMPIIKSTNGSEYQTGNWGDEIIGNDDGTSITQYWLSEGMDGWRLDVANEVSDETWQEFRKSVKALDSDNVIIGEIWTDAVEYLLGDMYDSVMNYVFRGAVLAYAKDGGKDAGKASNYINTLERLRERYPEEAFYAMMNLVSSHDTTRILSYLDGINDDRSQKEVDKAFPTYEGTSAVAKQKQYLVAFLQFTYAGAPTIYYGDEIGMVGADDPDDRRGMTWGKGNKELVEWYATLSNIRNNYDALKTGSVEMFDAKDEAIVSYVRRDDTDTMIVLANNTNANKTVEINLADLNIAGTDFAELISGATLTRDTDTVTVTVPAYSGAILTDSPAKALTFDKNDLAPAYDSAYIIKDAKVTLSKSTLELKKGTSETITAKARGTVEWSSSNTAVATVSNGNITAVGYGTATITATQEDGLTATCTVKAVASTSVTLNKTTASINKGSKLTLTATMAPTNTTDAVAWSTDKPAIATVSSAGVVEAKAVGTAIITATTTSGRTATCTITVTSPATKVTLNKTKTDVNKGKKVTLTATVTPADSTDSKITWKSSKTSVATVSDKGVVTGKAAGTATITATTANGKTATCKVTVKVPATSVKTSAKEYIVKGKTKNLYATLLPGDSTDKVTWKSSNTKVVTVDKNGKIKGIKAGTAKITVKTTSGKTAKCTVAVVAKEKKSTKVSLNKSKLNLKVGAMQMIKASMTSNKSTDSLTWTSSNKKVATVDANGNITAVKKGKATITVKTSSGKKATCEVTVK